MWLSLALWACGAEPPQVDQLDPAAGAAGAAVRIVGERFTPDTTATLGGQPVPDLVVRGATLLEGRVPEGLAPGPQELVLSAGGAEVARKAAAYTVEAPPPADEPCAGRYTAYSAVASDSQMIKIDRFYTGEDRRELIELPFRDITRIEYEELALADGRLCSVIFVRTKDDRRYMFDDDTEEKLRARAQELAVGLGKDISVQEAPQNLPEVSPAASPPK